MITNAIAAITAAPTSTSARMTPLPGPLLWLEVDGDVVVWVGAVDV